MNEWDVVMVAVIVIPILIAIITPIVRLTNVIATLNANMSNLSDYVSKTVNENTESHRRIWEKNEEQDEILGDHEKRIYHLEKKN